MEGKMPEIPDLEKKINYTTVGGKSLLQVCIDNEKPGRWLLEPMMEMILE